jgi:hypothetical protein
VRLGRSKAVLQRQAGAAILTAMLTVVLVATLAATALWQQWRGIEIEAAQRTRVQSAWVLTGALDWARLILREDARKGGADHLAEPWAVPLEQARLSTFLAADRSDQALFITLPIQFHEQFGIGETIHADAGPSGNDFLLGNLGNAAIGAIADKAHAGVLRRENMQAALRIHQMFRCHASGDMGVDVVNPQRLSRVNVGQGIDSSFCLTSAGRSSR